MIIEYRHKDALSYALEALRNEKVFVYPTDTIYGFGGDARSEKVILDLYELKARPVDMPVSMLVPDRDMLSRYAHTSSLASKLIETFLPGALTLVLPAKDMYLPQKLFSVQGYLGFRISDHKFCKRLSTNFDAPIITTSVNTSGQPALHSISDIDTQFGKRVGLLIADPELERHTEPKGSTVVMITKKDELKILREGAIPEKDIFELIA